MRQSGGTGTLGMESIDMLYAITDRRLYGNDEAESSARLLDQTAIWAANGVAFLQLREKDLPVRKQVELARAMLRAIRDADSGTRLLINGRPDVALAAGADGVHLPSGSDTLSPGEVRTIFASCAKQPYISVACHTLQDVEAARERAADCILFAPVFEKNLRGDSLANQAIPGSGLEMLAQACKIAMPVPVFALGGITAKNAGLCLQAGAAGVAAIRLVQEPPQVWRRLAR